MIETLTHIIEAYGLWVVFGCVLLNQGGIPVPAYAPMIVTAALAVDTGKSVVPLLFVAVVASLLADWIWFAGGRRYGATLLRLMCKLSLSPDSCVGLTRRLYARWGAPSLMVAKYIPGFAAVATTLAGEAGIRAVPFAIFDGVGAALWAGGAIAIGVIFHEAVAVALDELELLGRYAVALIVVAIVLLLLVKAWQRYRFAMRIRMARISPTELGALLASGAHATILDVRAPERRARSGWIPGSVPLQALESLRLEPHEEIVLYCDCPNDASAAVAAAELRRKGFSRVRPLAGGIEAWQAHGGSLENG
jgi:membrane protein DedA with SNARE-associated domain/rhodanese-related sulfurtransferase